MTPQRNVKWHTKEVRNDALKKTLRETSNETLKKNGLKLNETLMKPNWHSKETQNYKWTHTEALKESLNDTPKKP